MTFEAIIIGLGLFVLFYLFGMHNELCDIRKPLEQVSAIFDRLDR